jgi:signal transduction histidine kinase
MRFNFFRSTNQLTHPIPFQKVLWVTYGGFFFLLILDIFMYLGIEEGDWFSFSESAMVCGVLLLFILLDIYYQQAHQNIGKKMLFALLGLRVVTTEIYEWSLGSTLAPSLLYLSLPFVVYRYFGHRASNFSLILITVRISIAALIDLRQNEIWISNTDYLVPMVINIIFYIFVMVLIGAFVENVDQEKNQRLRAEQLIDELERVHAQIVDLAATEERNRLARDVHDSLGHYLTVINVQLEKALALQEKSPAVSTQAVMDAKRLTREALQDVRESMGTLRAPRVLLSIEQQLATLTQDAAKAGIQIGLQVEGSSINCSEHVTATLYRIIQEAVTNIRKHAQTSQAHIKLSFLPDSVELEIQDQGCGFNVRETSEGYGLRGLRERVELLGGTMQIKSQPGQGTRIFIQLPQNPITTRRLTTISRSNHD